MLPLLWIDPNFPMSPWKFDPLNHETSIIVFYVSRFDQLASLFAKQLPIWPDGRLPTVRELASRHAASTRTVTFALDLLQRQGLVESRPGAV
jgi:hypothetical protein